MSIINYILRKVIAKSKFPLFHVSNMLFFIEAPHEKKFEKFKNEIVENDFFSDTQKEIYIELFMKTQKYYHALCLFKKIWRESKYSFFDQETDLCFNLLSQFPESHKITLLHFDKKYIFRLTDFMNIWMNALTKRSLFTPQPRLPINPFINKPFRKHHLLKVYLKLQETKFQIPFLIQQFYKFNFNNYINSINYYDKVINYIWNKLYPETIIVTTDHGRGNKNWNNHYNNIKGSDKIWSIIISKNKNKMNTIKNKINLKYPLSIDNYKLLEHFII